MGNTRCTSRRSWRTDSLYRGARGRRRSPAVCSRPRRRLHPLAWQREQQGEGVSRAPRGAPLYSPLPASGCLGGHPTAEPTREAPEPRPPAPSPPCMPRSPSPPSPLQGRTAGEGTHPPSDVLQETPQTCPPSPRPPRPTPRPEKHPLSATAVAGASPAERTPRRAGCRAHTRSCARGWAGAEQPPRRRRGGEWQPRRRGRGPRPVPPRSARRDGGASPAVFR